MTVLYEGRQIYFGPINEAVSYFESLGFVRPERQTSADFLTAITNPGERILRPKYEHLAPRTAAEFAAAWKKSEQHRELLDKIYYFNGEYAIDWRRIKQWNDKREKERSSRKYVLPFYLGLDIGQR